MKSRLASAAVISALLGGSIVPSLALADDPVAADAAEPPPVQVYDTGDHVAVVVRGANADVENIRWRWGKMHVPIDVGPAKIFATSSSDATVKRVAVIGGESPRVMVLLRHGDKTAKKLTAATEIEPVEGGFRILIPRKQTLNPPAPPPAPAAEPVAAPAAAVEPTAPANPEVAAAAQTAEAAPAAQAEAPPLPVMSSPEPAAESDEDNLEGIATASTQTSQAAWMGVMTSLLMLAACGGALVWVKRRKGNPIAGTKFEVMGNQSLGGKSRLVLLGLGDRRMLLAVSEAGTALVDKWTDGAEAEATPTAAIAGAPRIDRDASSPLSALEFDAPRGDLRIAKEPAWIDELRGAQPANDEGDPPDAESSAVTGLLELRRRSQASLSRQERGPDEDRWAEALAAQLRAGDA